MSDDSKVALDITFWMNGSFGEWIKNRLETLIDEELKKLELTEHVNWQSMPMPE